MDEIQSSPQYLRIASDIASRVVEREWSQGQKLSGRSLLASEYAVSPETIRRALKLLADMKVVEIKEKSGVTILSADNAVRYLKGFEGWSRQRDLQRKMRELINQSSEINRSLLETYDELLKSQDTPLPAEKSLPNYEVRVSESSNLIGKNIGSLKFWQATRATIVAIKRTQNIIVSPGPFAEIYGGDTIVFVGLPSSVSAVESFVNGSEKDNPTPAQKEPKNVK